MDSKSNFNKGISLKDLLFILKKNWLVIVIFTMFTSFVGGIYGFNFKKTIYKAQATGIVMTKSSDDGRFNGSDYTYSTNLVNTFIDFVVCDPVVDNAVAKLNDEYGYELSRDEVQKNASVNCSNSSVIINLTYTCGDSEQAIRVTNQLIDSTIEIARVKVDDLNGDGELDYKYEILANKFVDMNYAKSTSASRGASIVILVSFLIGFILSYLFFLIKFLLDDTYTSKEEYEEITKIKIIAAIPDATSFQNNVKGITE